MSEVVWMGFLDEAAHREERLALIRAAKKGDRNARDRLFADFEAWRQSWRDQLAFLAGEPFEFDPVDWEFGCKETPEASE